MGIRESKEAQVHLVAVVRRLVDKFWLGCFEIHLVEYFKVDSKFMSVKCIGYEVNLD